MDPRAVSPGLPESVGEGEGKEAAWTPGEEGGGREDASSPAPATHNLCLK